MGTGCSLILVDYWANGYSLFIHLSWPPCVDIGLVIHPGWLCEWPLVWLHIWVDLLGKWTVVCMIIHLGWLLCEWALVWSQLWAHKCAKGYYKWVKLSLVENPLYTKPVFMFDLSSFKISQYPFAKFLKHCIFLNHCVFLVLAIHNYSFNYVKEMWIFRVNII